MSAARSAVYYAPAEGSPWAVFGEQWLAGTAFGDVTAEPRRYGFHATLKAPFRLAPATAADGLLARVQALAATLRPVPLGTLVPVCMDGFVALVPSVPNPALGTLAQACVAGLDDLRAPMNEEDMARRGAGRLDARGRELLERFGYPHVMERFRFHMTLTGPVDLATAGHVVAQLARPVLQLNAQAPPMLDRLCIFTESRPGAAFVRTADVALA